jgi:hypothetical protein
MNRQALVIGINRYPFLKDAKGESQHLTTPARDASAIAHILELYGHFQVTRYPSKDPWEVDPKPETSVKADHLKNEIIRLFHPKVNIPDTALLFFAGCGFRQQNPDGTTEGFLGTSDANPRKNKWGISLKWLRQVLQDSPIQQQQIVWLDCGFSGELFNFTEAETDKERQRCLITATQDYEEAHALKDQHGLLTQAILGSLDPNQYPNNIVDNYFLSNSININFQNNPHQHPNCSNTAAPIIITSTTRIGKKEQHRLQRLWQETEDWFTEDDNEVLMKHCPRKVSKYFSVENPEQDKAKHYREQVEKALGGTSLPDSWWQEQSVYHLHESLKSLCGYFFAGSDQKITGKKHISVGSAYLIALIAYQELFPNNLALLTEKVENWTGRTKASKSWLFPLQDEETTRTSAMALYDLFDKLFQPSPYHSQVINICFDTPGNKLVIEFNWRANKPAEEGGESLADWTKLLEGTSFFIPDKAVNTRNAILRLLGSMFVSKAGFLSPGVVYMEENTLVIASTK